MSVSLGGDLVERGYEQNDPRRRLFARQLDLPRERRRILVPGEPANVGAFRVTAYPVDHSAYDAMAFLVEADGQRLLSTGDSRFHGRKPGMAQQLVKVATAAPLDALLDIALALDPETEGFGTLWAWKC